MANRNYTPIMFALEKNVVFLSARITFGSAGAPTLDTTSSKGVCSVALKTISFTGTTSASTSVTSVSSYAGLYTGMLVSDGGVHVPASTSISSMNAGASTLTLSQAATGTNTGLTASGGQYTIQFGTQASTRLDTYNRLLHMGYSWDESALQGNASTLPSSPVARSVFLVGNSIATAGTATVTIQMGSYSGTTFSAQNPTSGDALRLFFVLSNSTAG